MENLKDGISKAGIVLPEVSLAQEGEEACDKSCIILYSVG